MYNAVKESEGANDTGEACYNISTLIGSRDDTVGELLARRLIASISETTNKSLILSVCWKNPKAPPSIPSLKSMMAEIEQQRIW
mmetsp:Transcript_43578/g.85339  ORF Transcript_43578/g.85339 Transcript_43578/m.85339 type:complete len:84 (+) Transcript_43578:159-410(+)